MVVVFPEPFGPRNPYVLPAGTRQVYAVDRRAGSRNAWPSHESRPPYRRSQPATARRRRSAMGGGRCLQRARRHKAGEDPTGLHDQYVEELSTEQPPLLTVDSDHPRHRRQRT